MRLQISKYDVFCLSNRPILVGNLVLTYFGYWDQIDRHYHPEAAADFYIAPGMHGTADSWGFCYLWRLGCLTVLELNGMLRVSPAADWWSFGVILFELLTGKVKYWL